MPRIAVAVAIAIAREPISTEAALGGLEQLAGVAVGGLVAVSAAQHPHDLRDELIAVDSLDGRRRLPAIDALLDPEVGSAPSRPPGAGG